MKTISFRNYGFVYETYVEGDVGISLTSFTQPHCCSCPMAGSWFL